jgi:hypothetical protein
LADVEQPVEFDENTQEKIEVFAGLSDDGSTPFVRLTIGAREIYLPCAIALSLGLTLQQVAYTSTFIRDAQVVAKSFINADHDMNLFHQDLLEAVFNGIK